MQRHNYLLPMFGFIVACLMFVAISREALSTSADVNSDGVVNILDLIIVGKHLGETLPVETLEAENKRLREENAQLKEEIDRLKNAICNGMEPPWEELINAGPLYTVDRVIDGDTIKLSTGHRIRYIGIDTPEKDSKHYEQAEDANGYLVEEMELTLEFDIDKCDEDHPNYEKRVLAYIYVGETFVNLELVRSGWARARPVGQNLKYQDEFARAEAAAKEEKIGIWETVASNIEIEKIDAIAEWVKIVNMGAVTVDMTGYTLTDVANHKYTFPNFILPAGGTVKVYTADGADTAEELYCGCGKYIWNNTGDTAWLRDAEGFLVDEYSY